MFTRIFLTQLSPQIYIISNYFNNLILFLSELIDDTRSSSVSNILLDNSITDFEDNESIKKTPVCWKGGGQFPSDKNSNNQFAAKAI